jgi:hypothetical protein
VPTFKNQTLFELWHGVRAFLTVEVGISRNGVSGHREEISPRGVSTGRPSGSSSQQIERPGRRPVGQVSAGPRAAHATHDLEARADDISPENIIWIFGTARTGSTWLSSMMGEIAEGRLWREPLVGQLFGSFYDGANTINFKRPHFIFSDTTRDVWLNGIKLFVLNAIRGCFSGRDKYLVVVEPNGSLGAPLLMEAFPESRMILLMRDPRDVAASALDRHRKGGDAYKIRSQDPRKSKTLAKNAADHDPDGFVKTQAKRYLRNVGSAKQAFDNHRGPKVMVKYEDLRAQTLQTMKRLYSGLSIGIAEAELARVVEKHAWENIPEEQKGPGKSNRKASPGSWREDLTPKQVEFVERMTAPLLKEFYPDEAVNAVGGGSPS